MISLHSMDGGVDNFDAAPASAGGVTIVALTEGREIEVLCRASGWHDMIIFDGEEPEVYEEKGFGYLAGIIRGLDWLTKKSSVSCILGGIYLVQAATPARSSRTQAMAREYQSYALSASQKVSNPSVIIYGNIPTNVYPETHQ